MNASNGGELSSTDRAASHRYHSYLEEARHRLQATDKTKVDAILERR